MTVGEFMALIGVNDHDLVIYDENVVGNDADNYGDLLYDSGYSRGNRVPDDLLDLLIVGIDLEETLCRLWVDSAGIPNNSSDFTYFD